MPNLPLPQVAITTEADLHATDHQLLAYLSAAERGGVVDIANPTTIADLQNLLQHLTTTVPRIVPFIAQVGLAIGFIPIVSDIALNTLPEKIRDEVRRARAVQRQRDAVRPRIDLTPATSLIIAQANSDAGKAQNFTINPPPLGQPVGAPVEGTPWTHA
jgi:hypothetical protein